MDAAEVVAGRLATVAGGRVYPLKLPDQPQFPAVTYQQISAVRTHAMGKDAPLIRVRMQVNVWGKTYAEARATAGAVANRLSRFRGTVGATRVLDVLLDNELETYESDNGTRRVIQDYSLLVTAGSDNTAE